MSNPYIDVGTTASNPTNFNYNMNQNYNQKENMEIIDQGTNIISEYNVNVDNNHAENNNYSNRILSNLADRITSENYEVNLNAKIYHDSSNVNSNEVYGNTNINTNVCTNNEITDKEEIKELKLHKSLVSDINYINGKYFYNKRIG